MARVRTFIAVDVGDVVRGNATALQKQLARTGAAVKWVEPESMHVTLQFLGEVDERDLLKVCRTVATVARSEPPFALRVSGLGAFPTPRRPKVVWGGITDGADALRRLFGKLEAPLLELGVYRKEDRDYTPHLTLGRARGEADGTLLAGDMARHLAWEGGQTAVEELLVMSSEMERGGPVYAALGRAPLLGEAGEPNE